MLEQLHGDGVPLDELRKAIDEHRLTLLPVDQVLGGGGKYTLPEVADRAGLSAEFLGKQRQASGCRAPTQASRSSATRTSRPRRT